MEISPEPALNRTPTDNVSIKYSTVTLFFLIEPLALKLKAFSRVEIEPYNDLQEVEEG